MNLRSLRPLVPTLALPALILALIAGCGTDEPEGRVVKPTPEPSPEAAPAPQPQAGAAAQGAGNLSFDLPEGWQSEPPSNTMRQAQARIPGDGGAGEFALFYFGPGGGGGTEANIERWLGQVELDPGTEPERETVQVGEELTAHTVVARGTVTPSPMTMQGGNPEPQPGQMLLGAVIEGPGGPWFFKVTGPEETIEPYRDEFFQMVRDVELAGA
ncbi:MAG: hypothetical protein ACLF0P_13225 [Thermoanaerobaculia bacterium]